MPADRGRHHQDGTGRFIHDPPGGLDAIGPRHEQIHEDQIGPISSRHRHGLLTIVGNPRHLLPGTDSTTRRSTSQAMTESLTMPILMRISNRQFRTRPDVAALYQMPASFPTERAHFFYWTWVALACCKVAVEACFLSYRICCVGSGVISQPCPNQLPAEIVLEHDLGDPSGSAVGAARRAGCTWPEQTDRKMSRNV